MIEHKVDSTPIIDGKKFRVVEDLDKSICKNCEFDIIKDGDKCFKLACGKNERKDGKSVYFVKEKMVFI